MTSILEPVRREAVRIKSAFSGLFVPGQEAPRALLCPNCECELEPGHSCESKGLSRRVFFGLLGASSAALAMRVQGVPIPGARVEVIARAGDMFEVDTMNPFTVAWEGAKNKNGGAFRNDAGIVQDGGILEFHGRELANKDVGLRVHRGLSEMRVLGVIDKVTGKPVPYRIVRQEEVERRVISLNERKLAEVLRQNPGANAALAYPSAGVPVFVNTESGLTNRAGTGKCDVSFKDGIVFNIEYTAGTVRSADHVKWSFHGPPLLLEFKPPSYIEVDGTGNTQEKTCPTHGRGILHKAISDINRFFPDRAPLLRQAIMSLNPEYRQRTGAVRLQMVEGSDYDPEKVRAAEERRKLSEEVALKRRIEQERERELFGRFTRRFWEHPAVKRYAGRMPALAGPRGVLPA